MDGGADRATLQAIFQSVAIDLSRHPAVVGKAVRAIRQCRTAALGGQVAHCTACGYEHFVYHSCRNRHCPQCQRRASERWVRAREAQLLPVPYYHVVFTLPHALNGLIAANRERLFRLLFAEAWATLRHFGQRYLGGELGASVVLHTWGQTLVPHVHVHCLVTAGAWGGDEEGWTPARGNYLFPVKAITRWFRRGFLDGLKAAHHELRFPGDLAAWADSSAFNRALTPLYNTDWTVYFKPPFGGPRHLLAYLARYTHRVAISDDRIERIDDHGVTFHWRDYRDAGRVKRMTLPIGLFADRFIWHILPHRFVRIRHYGLNANNARAKRECVCRALEAPLPQACAAESLAEYFQRVFRSPINRCPKCHRPTLLVMPLPRPRARDPPTRVAPRLG